MCKPAIVKECEKNLKKLTMKNVLNEQKYYEILQNFKILHSQSKLQDEIFKLVVLQQKHTLKVLQTEMTFFILVGKEPNSS